MHPYLNNGEDSMIRIYCHPADSVAMPWTWNVMKLEATLVDAHTCIMHDAVPPAYDYRSLCMLHKFHVCDVVQSWGFLSLKFYLRSLLKWDWFCYRQVLFWNLVKSFLIVVQCFNEQLAKLNEQNLFSWTNNKYSVERTAIVQLNEQNLFSSTKNNCSVRRTKSVQLDEQHLSSWTNNKSSVERATIVHLN